MTERFAAERQKANSDAPPIEVLCEECGERSFFPAAQNGMTKNCLRCSAYLDVGDPAVIEGWDEAPLEDENVDGV